MSFSEEAQAVAHKIDYVWGWVSRETSKHPKSGLTTAFVLGILVCVEFMRLRGIL